jgi:RNA polymerase II subunit A small phosphatase-like protein
MQKPKKSRGFLSFLNCCSVPDNANGIDSEEAVLPVKQIATVPSQARATTSSKPISSTSDPNSGHRPTSQGEKIAMVGDEHNQLTANPTTDAPSSAERGTAGKPPVSVDSRNQALPAIPQDAEKSALDPGVYDTSNPAVFVQAPTPNLPQQDSSQTINHDESSHVVAEESLATAAQERNATDMEDVQPSNATLPPPPPIPSSESSSNPSSPPQELTTADAAKEKQQWLLPPIEPRFEGKKCLVLDLDETLVHSSFKVCGIAT